jgi:hypothetical protein
MGAPSGDLARDYVQLRTHVDELRRWMADTLRQFNRPGSVKLSQATIEDTIIGASNPSSATFTTIEATGLITATGGQVRFPATQAASADANTLDDYEEGTFTPALAGSTTAGTQTYSTRNGTYTKIGRMVVGMGGLVLTAKDGATAGNLLITGLPFTSAATFQSPAIFGYVRDIDLNVAGGYYTMAGLVNPSTSRVELFEIGDNLIPANLTAADFGTNTNIYFTVIYFV